jgi:hypothetical protein
MLPHGVMIDVSIRRSRADLGGQARAIVDRCGPEREDACLAFHKTRHVKMSRSVQVHEPIYRTSVGRWRQVRGFSSH